MQSKQFPKVTLLVLLVASLLISACGGGSDRHDTATVNTPQPNGANAGDTVDKHIFQEGYSRINLSGRWLQEKRAV
jgi:hypothetical protein